MNILNYTSCPSAPIIPLSCCYCVCDQRLPNHLMEEAACKRINQNFASIATEHHPSSRSLTGASISTSHQAAPPSIITNHADRALEYQSEHVCAMWQHIYPQLGLSIVDYCGPARSGDRVHTSTLCVTSSKLPTMPTHQHTTTIAIATPPHHQHTTTHNIVTLYLCLVSDL